MQEMFLRIQDACLQLRPAVLVTPAVISMFAGLFLWLGGVRYAFVVVGLLGAMLGAAIGLFIGRWFGLPTSLSVAIGAAIVAIAAMLMQHTVVVLLATVILATACGLGYMSYTIDTETWRQEISRIRQRVRSGGSLSDPDSSASSSAEMDYLRSLVHQAENETIADDRPSHDKGLDKLRTVLAEMRLSATSNRTSLVLWAIIGAGVGLVLAYLVKKIMMAVCCSIVGTTGIIGGVLALFLARGSAVFTSLQSRPQLLPVLFAAMIVFGCLIQLMFARPAGKKSAKTQESDEEE